MRAGPWLALIDCCVLFVDLVFHYECTSHQTAVYHVVIKYKPGKGLRLDSGEKNFTGAGEYVMDFIYFCVCTFMFGNTPKETNSCQTRLFISLARLYNIFCRNSIHFAYVSVLTNPDWSRCIIKKMVKPFRFVNFSAMVVDAIQFNQS